MDWMKLAVGITATIVEKGSNGITYIAEAKEDTALASDPVWRVRRVKVVTTSGGVERTTVAWAGGTCAFRHSAANMASLTYADY